MELGGISVFCLGSQGELLGGGGAHADIERAKDVGLGWRGIFLAAVGTVLGMAPKMDERWG